MAARRAAVINGRVDNIVYFLLSDVRGTSTKLLRSLNFLQDFHISGYVIITSYDKNPISAQVSRRRVAFFLRERVVKLTSFTRQKIEVVFLYSAASHERAEIRGGEKLATN